MTASLGSELPDELLEVLGGRDLASAVGFTVLLLTVREDGWPHQAMLSVGEVLANRPSQIRLALWETSTAATNLARARRGTLTCVVGETAYAIRLTTTAMPDLRVAPDIIRARFHAVVEEVTADRAPYAVLESGVRYRLIDERSVLQRWRATISALRLASPGPAAATTGDSGAA